MSGTSTPASNSFEGAYEIYPNLFGTGGSLPGIPRGDTVTAISTDGVTFTVVNPGSTSASSGATVGGTYLSFSADSVGDVSISPLQPNQSLIDQINANSGALTPLSDTLYYQVSDANGQISSFADQFALGDTSFSEPDMPPYSQLGTVSPGDTLDLGGLTVSKALSTNQTDNSGYTLSVSVGVFDFSNQAPDGQLSVSTDVEGGGGTVTYGDPTNPAYLQLTIEGTIAEINADLTTLAYTAVNPGSDAVVLADTDSPTPITNVIVGNIEVPCFCRGTLIRTPRGEVPVERLRVGDEVTTLSGQARPLTWVGRGRSLVTAANPNARPIIVRAGALADGVPVRDLYLTRGHSLLLDGVLIPVEYLVNDRSVLWDAQARVVEFFHLELEHHDILLADGAEAESYREDGNRHLFHNTDAPRHATHGMAPYAPVRTGGPEVDQRVGASAGPRHAGRGGADRGCGPAPAGGRRVGRGRGRGPDAPPLPSGAGALRASDRLAGVQPGADGHGA